MIVIIAFLIGATGGALRARARKGNWLDIAQYAAVYGLIFATVGVFVTILVGRNI